MVAALATAAACGSSGGSGASATGGDAGSSGHSGAGGRTSSGGRSGSAGELAASGGDQSTSGSGTFEDVWEFQKTEVTYFDITDPGASGDAQTIEFPSTFAAPDDGREVEIYVQFQGDQLITYAHYVGDESGYYRLTQPAFLSEETYIVSLPQSVESYTIESGQLSAFKSATNTTSALVSFRTTYKKYEGDFPPSDWPSNVVAYDSSGEQP